MFPLPVSTRAGALALLGSLLAGAAMAEPFVVEDMPAGFDGVIHPWYDARRPVAADFNGDGQPSWYAGGLTIAHPKAPTPLDPLHYASVALPAVTLNVCPSCQAVPMAFAVGDVNRDGKPDIMRLDEWQGQTYAFTLSVFLGDGADGFTQGWRYDWESNPGYDSGPRYFQVALADFDLDGDLDLVMLSTYDTINDTVSPRREEGSLRIRWNAGTGSFTSETVLQARDFSWKSQLLVGDFDRDGDIDITVDNATVYSNDVNYTVTTKFFSNDRAQSFTASGRNYFLMPLALADINRDGWLDYVYDGAGGVAWLNNNRSGSWDNAKTFASVDGRRPLAIAVADFDEDGLPDLMAAEGSYNLGTSRNLAFHRGLANGTTDSGTILATLPSDILQIGVGDARGDADQDLLLRLDDRSFRFVRNTAQRLSVDASGTYPVEPLAGISRLGVADSNRDGKDDVFALDPAGHKLRRLLGNGNDFEASEFKTLSGAATDFALGDFNRDGRPDFAYVEPTAGVVRTVMQNDSIYFGWTDSKIADYAGAALIRAGNGNYNGSTDLAVGSNSSGGLRWFNNQADATSWAASDRRASYAAMPTGLALVPRYNGNPIGDSVFACNADAGSVQANGYSPYFGHDAQLTVVNTAQTSAGICATANLDGDADPELVFVDGEGNLAWWSPQASGTGISGIVWASMGSSFGQISAIAPVDWNRDGLDDLLVATTNAGLFVLTREGVADAWVRHPLNGGNTAVTDVVAIDANRDGRPDAVFADPNGLRLVYNRSGIVKGTTAAVPAPSPASVTPGQSGTALAFKVVNPGRMEEDASVALTGLRVKFLSAVQNGASWTIGPALAASQVQQAVTSVSVTMDGLVIGTAGTAAVQADGSLQVDYNAVLGHVVPIAADAAKDVQVRVNLKPGAGSASYTDFFLQHSLSAGGAAVLVGSDPVGRSGDVAWTTTNRVHISSDVIFKNGFD